MELWEIHLGRLTIGGTTFWAIYVNAPASSTPIMFCTDDPIDLSDFFYKMITEPKDA